MAEKYIPYDGTASPGDFQDGAIIDSTHFTNEFDQLGLAFGTGGHNHDGTAGSGPKIGSGGIVTSDTYDMAGLVVDSLTITSGTAVTSIDTDLSTVSTTDNTLASAKAIKTYVDAQVTASDLDFQGDSGGALSIDLDSETLTIAGGTGLSTTGSGNTLTVDIDSTVATLTGSQTLTNKTIASPVITGNLTTNGNIDGRDVATDGTKLDGIETGATADQTAAEIRSLVESATDSNVFTDADHTKLDGIEASADVTDTANVTAAGALMDSEVTNLAQVKAFSSADYATAAQGTTADSAVQPADNISVLTNNSGYITGNQTITLSGDATGSGTTAITVALEANTVGVNELNLTDGTAGQFLKTDGAGTISFATAPTQATNFTTLEIEPTDDHAILYLRNTTANTFVNSKSYHEIRWDAKDLAGVDVNYALIQGITGFDDKADLRFKVKEPSLATYLTLSGQSGLIEANKTIRMNQSGNGILFSATADASGMDNELLDDYEEGTWTPILTTTGTDFGSVTHNASRSGTYTKIGRQVTVHCFLAWNNIVFGSASGDLAVGGLPFTKGSTVTQLGPAYSYLRVSSPFNNATLAGALNGSTKATLYKNDQSNEFGTSTITPNTIDSSSTLKYLQMTLTYEV